MQEQVVTHWAMVVILQHTTAAYTAVVCPLGDEHTVLAPNNGCLTSGLDPPHLEHRLVDAGVIFRSTDQLTPFVNGLREVCCFFAQIKLLPERCG